MTHHHPKSAHNPNGSGRPPKEIDWEKVDRCLEAGLSGVQAAAYIGVHWDTLYNAVQREKGQTFTEYSAKKNAKGETMIGLKQFQEAMKGDRGMLIWLGKQRLKQKENHDLKVSTEGFSVNVNHYGDTKDPKPYQAGQASPSSE